MSYKIRNKFHYFLLDWGIPPKTERWKTFHHALPPIRRKKFMNSFLNYFSCITYVCQIILRALTHSTQTEGTKTFTSVLA